MKKRGTAFKIFLIIIIVAIVGFNVKRELKLNSFMHKFDKEGKDYYLEEIDYEAENERILKSQPSEIEGMTRYDKAQAGLSPYLSDTDMDGLSDKDELEIGSNPTKASTSGDYYPDGYKVLHDMDLNTYYEFDADKVTLDGVTVDNVSVNISCAEDFNGNVIRYPVDERYKGVYEIYRINGFHGEITLDLSDVLKKNNISMDEVGIYCKKTWDDGDLDKCKYKAKDNLIRFDTDFGNETKYLYIVNAKEHDLNPSYEYSGKGIIFGSPIIRKYLNGKFNIWYTETDNYEFDEQALKRMKKEADVITVSANRPVSTENDNIEVKKESEINIRYKLLQYILPMFECDSVDNMKWYQIFFYYSDYSDFVQYQDEYIKLQGKLYTGKKMIFDFDKDVLPFGNFGSEISHGGNCAGIATLTARTFNGNFIPSSGEYDIKRHGLYVWDISKDKDNSTLLNKGLSDYKDKEFTKNHINIYKRTDGKIVYILDKDLSEGEEQFMHMIGCYWAEYNDIIENNSDYVYLPSNVKYSCNRIEAAKDVLNDDKILIAGFRDPQIGGHAVNIVGYEDLPNGNTKFYIYDNNYPDITDLYLLIQPCGDGTFDYVYKAPGYEFSSLIDGNMLTICDDKYNELTLCIWSVDDVNDIKEQEKKELEEKIKKYLHK